MAIQKNKAFYSLLIKLSISFVLLISVTTAWFIFTQHAIVDPLPANVVKLTSVSVSGNNGVWSDNLEITHDSKVAVPVTEYSGNGKSLFGPIVMNKQVVSFFTVDESAANNGYIDFTLKFKADGPVDIYLGGDSALLPESFESNLNSNNVSKNYIVGAVRLAMWCVEDDGAPVIWAPNSKYQYNSTTKKLNVNGTVESQYQYAVDNTIDTIRTIETNGVTNGTAEDGRFIWGDVAQINLNDMAPVMNLSPEKGSESIKTLNVRVWVEGTDREAVKDFIGGKFKIKLNFTAVSKEGGEA